LTNFFIRSKEIQKFEKVFLCKLALSNFFSRHLCAIASPPISPATIYFCSFFPYFLQGPQRCQFPLSTTLLYKFYANIGRSTKGGYSGRVVCIGPPPYFEKNSTLADYQEAKKSMRKVSETLSLIGYAFDFFCHKSSYRLPPHLSPSISISGRLYLRKRI
jgi:hypothetical protein